VCAQTPAGSGQTARRRRRGPAQRGQALLETALVLPVLLLLAFGVVGVGRVLQAQMAVSAVAREAARVAALAGTPSEASARGAAHALEVARGYGLTQGSLEVSVDPGELARGGQVRSAARYDVALDDLPLLGWARVTVRSEHVERVDLYRSRWSGGER
jgi:Flp pilus assembly protein TadG